METNNPPNTAGFAKKSPARNKQRTPKRRSTTKKVDFDPSNEDNRKAITYLFACVFIVCATTVLKNMFDKSNAD